MKRKVLIVDDEIDFCVIMKGYFAKKGYDTLVAYDLQNGLSLIKTANPDVLLLDNNLPDGYGWKYVDEIVENNPHIKVYLISAHQNKSNFNSTNKNIIVWEKPISMQILTDAFQ